MPNLFRISGYFKLSKIDISSFWFTFISIFSDLDLVDRISNVRKSVDKTEAECDQITDRADQINEKVDKEMMPRIIYIYFYFLWFRSGWPYI